MNSSRTSDLVSRRHLLAGSVSVLMSGYLLAACGGGGEAQSLSLLNWQDYIGEDTLAGFTKKTGNDVVYQTYASNDALYTLLQQAMKSRRGGRQATSFDLCVPSGEALDRLRRAELVQPLGAVAGLDRISKDLQSLPFDPEGTYSIPWAAGTTGIAYDSAVVTKIPGWRDLFNGSLGGGKTSVLKDSREAMAMAAIASGKDPNDVGAFADAAKLLDGATFDSETYLQNLATGKVVAAQAFSTDFVQAARKRPSLRFVIPPEGGIKWVDVLVIPRGAPKPGRAREFIDYILDPVVSASLASAIGAQTAAAQPSPAPGSPPGEADALKAIGTNVDKCTFLRNLGSEEQNQLDDAWKKLVG
jgi:putrescine transport system substrate-binding protein